MPNLKTGRFTDADTWSRIRRESLIQWLSPAREYFAQQGIDLPAADSDGAIDYEKLAAVFVNADDGMPAYLLESLSLIIEMAHPEGMDALIAARRERGLPADFTEQTPIDIAVQTYLDAPALFEELHNQHQVNRPRSFVQFVARTRSGVQELRTMELPFQADTAFDGTNGNFVPPSAETLRELETQLRAWFVSHNRGSYCRVFMYPNGTHCVFLIRHGLPCKRENAIKDDASTCVFYRPQKHDVVQYDYTKGILGIHCCGKRELNFLRRMFGRHLFRDDEFFPPVEFYDLGPLVSDGEAALRCSDVPGLLRVSLCEVGFEVDDEDECEIAYRAKNVFKAVKKGTLKWPPPAPVTKATFQIHFTDMSSRKITLMAPNRISWGQDENCPRIEQWLRARGFAAGLELDEDEETSLAVA